MKVLKGKDQTGVLDESTGYIKLRNFEAKVPANAVLSAGDSIRIKGEQFDILEYNPSWFAETSKRGAQVIHPKDAAYIIAGTGIRCGSHVLEAGVGSGAMSSAILWAIGSTGKLVSVDNDSSAIRIASGNVNNGKATENWELLNGDIRSFSLTQTVDAAILDMPDPWNALDNVGRHLRQGGVVATYSPTFNQAEETVEKMDELNFSVIETAEIMKRRILVRPDATRPDHRMLSHTAFITFAAKRSGHVTNL